MTNTPGKPTKTLSIILAVVLVAVAVFAGITYSQKADLEKKVNDLTAQVTNLEGELATAKQSAEEAAAAVKKAAEEAAKALEAPKYKIAIMTGTVSQGEEEYRAAEMLKNKYPDIVITDTYPDRFAAEVETTVGKLLAFAADPEVKAIIMCQAVQGSAAAFTQIKNELKRDDILLIAGVPAEDPQTITSAADFVMGVDEINGGIQIAQTAKDWGAEWWGFS